MSSQPHASILCSLGLGHLIPVLELAKRLVTHRNFTVTIFANPSPASKTESELLKAAATPKFFDIIELPPPDISGCVGPDVAVATLLSIMMCEVQLAFRTESLSIGDELGIPKYVYITSTAWFIASTVYVPVFDKEVEGEYVDQTEPLRIPSCKPVQPEDVIVPMLDRTDQQYLEYMRNALRDEGLLGRVARVPVYPIGPLTKQVQTAGSTSTGLKDEGLFNWLDKQPCESVIFVSLGSGETVSLEQMTEMAWGLELSKQRFIWVVRPPAKSIDAAFLISGNRDDDPSTYLSKGFLTRTRDVGLESITNGVLMIVWPLYAKQRMNATMLTEELGVAVISKVLPSKKVVGREEVKEMVRKIMVDKDGQAIRGWVKELKLSAARAWSVGGSSYNALSQISSGNQRKC
ncbi:hypothetical protein C1H46_005272 [Malus baccata]|uniref:UDP-glycosyltransferases domain-containing protein n=1 Tax=Malus baccata TaxID=106549 RepID=A0A540NDK2_MALBA|nr:hypothetical protein C1H46_005272 [Malus baccata]